MVTGLEGIAHLLIFMVVSTPIWGVISVWFLYRGTVALATILVYLDGRIRGTVSSSPTGHLVQLFLFYGLFAWGQYYVIHSGLSELLYEAPFNLMYWGSAVITLIVLLRRGRERFRLDITNTQQQVHKVNAPQRDIEDD